VIRFGAPILLVLIWSTGFVVARVAAPHGDLQFFLVLRFALTAAVMGLMALAMGAKWPRGRELWPHVLAGALMQGVYLSASYWAIARGLAVGVMALLGALQPLSPPERQVLALLAERLGNADIAKQMHISDKTVRDHASNLFDKLGVWSRAQAIVFARDHDFNR
jgi:DNA-binding CsgD family transcriptional regulator